MDYLSNHERKKRGTDSFPLDLYNVKSDHPRYDMPYHWHKEVEFVLVHSGEFHASLDGVEYVLSAGDALYIGSGVIHGGTPKDCVYDCIDFDRDTLLFQSEIVRKTIKDIEGRGRILPYFKDGSGLANLYTMSRSSIPIRSWLSWASRVCLGMSYSTRISKYDRNREQPEHDTKNDEVTTPSFFVYSLMNRFTTVFRP